MECPYCKKEMAKGKIPTVRDSVFWCPADKEIVSLSSLDDDVVMLGKATLFTGANAVAYYCEDCKMVFTPVPEKIESTMDKLKKKWDNISEKMEASAEARQARQEKEKREKQREKRGKKDPWER